MVFAGASTMPAASPRSRQIRRLRAPSRVRARLSGQSTFADRSLLPFWDSVADAERLGDGPPHGNRCFRHGKRVGRARPEAPLRDMPALADGFPRPLQVLVGDTGADFADERLHALSLRCGPVARFRGSFRFLLGGRRPVGRDGPQQGVALACAQLGYGVVHVSVSCEALEALEVGAALHGLKVGGARILDFRCFDSAFAIAASTVLATSGCQRRRCAYDMRPSGGSSMLISSAGIWRTTSTARDLARSRVSCSAASTPGPGRRRSAFARPIEPVAGHERVERAVRRPPYDMHVQNGVVLVLGGHPADA